MAIDDAATHELIARRAARLGPAYRLFYDEPLHAVRGEGVWLFDADGRPHLDAYNNVASVGHCHPRVVAALAEQAARLNTHTRYLHEGILDYAEQLLATMPAELGQAMFTCTGSEANDLALRIARAHTGATGVIVSHWAYHGVTAATAEASPSLGAHIRLGDAVRTVPAPRRDVSGARVAPPIETVGSMEAPLSDATGKNPAAISGSVPAAQTAQGGGEDDAAASVGSAFAAGVHAAIADLAAAGLRPAALLVDTVFSSDGIFTDPPGFLAEAVAAVRRAGGIFIADEVQAGLGRTGDAMWGFQRHHLVPDIVTMGKPLGAGHPLAAVAVRPEVLAAFGRDTRYFNTFGGNPVSMAVGRAVLDVIRDQGLMENARIVGAGLRRQLRALADRHELIGQVRGAGLFIGVELVADRVRRTPASAATTARVVNAMRGRGVLISSAGPAANVLKIRPPLVFSAAHGDQLVSTLAEVLEVL